MINKIKLVTKIKFKYKKDKKSCPFTPNVARFQIPDLLSGNEMLQQTCTHN